MPNAEFAARLRLVRAERATDRSDARVLRALRPKSDLLLLVEKKIRQVSMLQQHGSHCISIVFEILTRMILDVSARFDNYHNCSDSIFMCRLEYICG